MLTSISLQNFKCYKDKTTFPLSKINLLTGINGKGKSTFLQSMLLFKQTVEHDVNATALLLNGDYVKLGTFQDVKNSDTSITKPILIEFGFEKLIPLFYEGTDLDEKGNEFSDVMEDEKIGNFTLSYELESQDAKGFELEFANIGLSSRNLAIEKKNPLLFEQRKIRDIYTGAFLLVEDASYISRYQLFKLLPKYNIKLDSKMYEKNELDLENLLDFSAIHFVSADRLGPQEYYPKTNLNNLLEVGKRGEKVIEVLDEVSMLTLNIEINGIQYEELDSRILNENVSIPSLTGEWLSYILDTNVSIVIDTKSSPYISTLKFRFNDKDYTPLNVGFGYSYILPIIVSGLVAKDGEILIIENPEAHLHPRAQSRLAEFLARVASMGVQVFVESHSDHILNGLRVCVKKETLQPEDVQIFYFDKDENSTSPKVFMPQIDKDGRIEEWPDGFFDEWNNNLMELL